MNNDNDMEMIRFIEEFAAKCQGGKRTEDFGNLLTRCHRTHQQSIGRFIKKAIQVFATSYDEKRFDDRNADTCKMCAELLKITEEHSLPFI